MAVVLVDNGPITDLSLSMETLPDGGKAERVISIQADDTPVALTAAQARWAVTNATIALTSKFSPSALLIDYVLLSALVADLMYWMDGKDPATTAGDILTAGYSIRLSGGAMTNFKVIRATTVDGVAVVHAFKKPAT